LFIDSPGDIEPQSMESSLCLHALSVKMSKRVLLDVSLFDAADARKPEESKIKMIKLIASAVLVKLRPKLFVVKQFQSEAVYQNSQIVI
jgi:hypothetical protein